MGTRPRPLRTLTAAFVASALAAGALWAEAPPSIEARTAGMRKLEGFLPLYWDERAGHLFMEVARLDTELLEVTSLGAGLGSNDIGLDRGELTGSRIVFFERIGPKLLLVEPNYKFRSSSANPAEVRAVRDAFARSVAWAFDVAAETAGRVLVDLNGYLLRDGLDAGRRLRPGTYRLDPSRSTIRIAETHVFPKNTELEVELTFTLQEAPGAPAGGVAPGPRADFGGGGFLEGVGDVAASARAASLRVHHSWLGLPDGGYTPRVFDPRAGYAWMSFQDRSAPLGAPLDTRFIKRHRLRKRDPGAAASEAVTPIVYYLDPGVPEPVRGALLEGARWWAAAFEAAGYRNAFRVEMLPAGASPLDVRYNVIHWVHRSTRGWSTGATVTDPRTGEILKGVVTLGSLRVRHDYLMAEGLLSPYATGNEDPPGLTRWALARIRQLAAHEVGHTLGLAHNYYRSQAGRISVMEYPHPLVTLGSDGTLDAASVYAPAIGAWDKVAIAYGYQDFPAGTGEARALAGILEAGRQTDLHFLTNQDLGLHPRAGWWTNGTDPGTELDRIMAVRRAALARFGAAAVRSGRPLATLEEALVPLYLHHRYQVEAAAAVLGGQDYVYALRGNGRQSIRRAAAPDQRRALAAILGTLAPGELRLPEALLDVLAPRPMGYAPHRELFPRHTGAAFDVVAPAAVAAGVTLGHLLDAERAARLVEQHAVDPTLPGLEEVLARAVDAVAGAAPPSSYEREIARAVERVLADRLIALVAAAPMPQVRALAAARARAFAERLAARTGDGSDRAHASLVARDIRQSLRRPFAPDRQRGAPPAPPGPPIGDPGADWLRWSAPWCSDPR